MPDDLHTPDEIANRCFMVDAAAGQTIGYWRDEPQPEPKRGPWAGKLTSSFPPIALPAKTIPTCQPSTDDGCRHLETL